VEEENRRFFESTYSDIEIDNAKKVLSKKDSDVLDSARNGENIEAAIDIMENLRKDGYSHMEDLISEYEDLSDKYFTKNGSTKDEEDRMFKLRLELEDYLSNKEYLDARQKRKAQDDSRNKNTEKSKDESKVNTGESNEPKKPVAQTKEMSEDEKYDEENMYVHWFSDLSEKDYKLKTYMEDAKKMLHETPYLKKLFSRDELFELFKQIGDKDKIYKMKNILADLAKC